MFVKKSPHPYALVEALDEPACLFSADGEALYQNRPAQRLLENGAFPFKLMPDLAALRQALDALTAPNSPAQFALDGTPYRYDAHTLPNGTLVRLVPLRDQIQAVRITASLNHIPWGVLTCDLSSPIPKIIYSNECACRYLEMLPSALAGQSINDVLRVFGITDNLDSYVRGTGITCYDFEKGNEDKAVWYRLHFIPYQQDRPYCLLVLEDTTETKMREGKYFQAQRLEALGQLAGGVAHDFNNILSIIDGYARLGKKALDQPEQVRNCYDRIMQAVQRASSITAHLLTFGSHKVEKQAVCDLGRLLQDQEAMLRPLLDATIDLAIDVEEGLYIDIPEADVCQILLNLCINSRDAMPEGGQIIIEAGRRNKDLVFMRIIDTGSGMSPQVKARIFDPFYTTKDQGKGTGLGLSMVYGMVKDIKGEIEVVSQEGEGTSMTILFPASSHAPEKEEQAQTHDDVSLKGCTVLVAEDEPDLLEILAIMLEDSGIKVLQARNGNEALMIQDDYDGDIDFLVTDVVMPELNGVKLAELFSSVRPETKTLFMSGYPANGQMARVPLPENAILLPKPVQCETIVHVLKSMLAVTPKTKNIFKHSHGQWRRA